MVRIGRIDADLPILIRYHSLNLQNPRSCPGMNFELPSAIPPVYRVRPAGLQCHAAIKPQVTRESPHVYQA